MRTFGGGDRVGSFTPSEIVQTEAGAGLDSAWAVTSALAGIRYVVASAGNGGRFEIHRTSDF